MSIRIATVHEVREAEGVVRKHVSPAPLIRSYPLEKELGFPGSRRVWLKDYGWTPVGSFKLNSLLLLLSTENFSFYLLMKNNCFLKLLTLILNPVQNCSFLLWVLIYNLIECLCLFTQKV